jgi:hypothetical protein
MRETVAKGETHEDVEFVAGARGESYKTFDEAAAAALHEAIGSDHPVQLNVLVYGEAGARWWAGDVGVEKYRNDPEVSVFQRLEISARDVGMVA